MKDALTGVKVVAVAEAVVVRNPKSAGCAWNLHLRHSPPAQACHIFKRAGS